MSYFLACPVSFELEDANWYDDEENAREDALNWSVELNGEKVIVYEAIVKDGAYNFYPLYSIFA